LLRHLEIQMTLPHLPLLRIGTTAGIAAMLVLAACSQAVKQAGAQEPGLDTACALDGMVLKDFPGPKAQIQYAEGKPDFYCDLMELFAVVVAPERKRAIGAMFVQDMGKTDWAHPDGHWIAAKTALYVVGSRKTGSMGPAIASFASASEAAGFVAAEGGKVVAFDQVTPAMHKDSHGR
jgi:copper chaperone NosL